MQKIDGKTQLLAVIGDPIAHSLSPAIQNYFIEKTEQNLAYMAFNVKKEELASFFEATKTLRIKGFNATMPLKEACYELVDIKMPNAQNSVNTVLVENGKFIGGSTDGEGFVRSLKHNGIDLKSQRVVILGAGGAAKSVVCALKMNCEDLKICARTPSRAQNMITPSNIFSLDKLDSLASQANLLINCTPLGMEGFPDFENFDFLNLMEKGSLVYDLIYSPRKTRLLQAAEGSGLNTLNGLSHLLHQAALSYEIFTKILPDKEIIDYLYATL